MGKIIINNLSKQKDYKTVRLASTILAGYFRDRFLAEEADELGVNVNVKTNDETGEKTFTFTDRD